MFSGTCKIGELQADEVTNGVVSDINILLKKQRGNAVLITKEELLKRMKRMSVVVAWNDCGRVVGLGVLTLSGGLNFSCAEIRHLVIVDGQDITAIGVRIVQYLCGICNQQCVFIDGGVWVQAEDMKKIFISLGFKEKVGSRFRLRFRTTK